MSAACSIKDWTGGLQQRRRCCSHSRLAFCSNQNCQNECHCAEEQRSAAFSSAGACFCILACSCFPCMLRSTCPRSSSTACSVSLCICCKKTFCPPLAPSSFNSQRSPMLSPCPSHQQTIFFAPFSDNFRSMAAAARCHSACGNVARPTPFLHQLAQNVFARVEKVEDARLHSCSESSRCSLV